MRQDDFGYVIPLPSLQDAVYVDDFTVKSFNSIREAVIWAWKNRIKGKGQTDKGAQAYFSRHFNYYASHFSRAVREDSKSPMDLKMDYLPTFEAFVGNRAVTQYLSRISKTTIHEEIQALRA